MCLRERVAVVPDHTRNRVPVLRGRTRSGGVTRDGTFDGGDGKGRRSRVFIGVQSVVVHTHPKRVRVRLFTDCPTVKWSRTSPLGVHPVDLRRLSERNTTS